MTFIDQHNTHTHIHTQTMAKKKKVAVASDLSPAALTKILDYDPNSFLFVAINTHWLGQTREILLEQLKTKAKAKQGVYQRVRSRSRGSDAGAFFDDDMNLRITKSHQQWPFLTSLDSAVQSVTRYIMAMGSFDPKDLFTPHELKRAKDDSDSEQWTIGRIVRRFHEAVGRSGTLDVAKLHLKRYPQNETIRDIAVGAVDGDNISILRWCLEPEETAALQCNHTANEFTEQDMHRRDHLKQLLRRAAFKGRAEILLYMVNWLLGMPRVPGVTDLRRPEGTVYLLDQQTLLNNMALGQQANMFEIFHTQHFTVQRLTVRWEPLICAATSGSVPIVQYLLSLVEPDFHVLSTAVVSAAWHKQQAVMQLVRDLYPNFPHDTLIEYTNKYLELFPNSHIGTGEFANRVESDQLRLIREPMNLMFQSFKQIASCLIFPEFMIDF